MERARRGREEMFVCVCVWGGGGRKMVKGQVVKILQ